MPHTSAGSPLGGSAATLSPGAGWANTTVFRLDTRRQYDHRGQAQRFFAEGHLVVTSVITTAAVGVIEGLDVRAQLPFHVLSYQEVSGSRDRAGVGDLRLEVRAGPELLGLEAGRLPADVAVRGGLKLPGEEFPVDSQIIPLTEGQRDWELALELSGEIPGASLAIHGWAGYRWREENTSIQRLPANERFGFLSVAGGVGPVGWSVGGQWIDGGAHRILGIRVPSTRRRILELFPGIGAPLGPGWASVGARIPVTGRNLPAGNALSLSYALGWGGES